MTMAPYAQQVLISTGQPNWRSRIEEDGVDQGWGTLVRGLKGLIGRGGKFADVSGLWSQVGDGCEGKRLSAG